MFSGDPHWSEPKRVRSSLLQNGHHLGYITIVSYPNRDISAFPEGSPYFEVVVSDLADQHVALLQRFRQHWLIQCGERYATAEASGALNPEQIQTLAMFAMEHAVEGSFVLAAALRVEVERMLGERAQV